jgi:hypothetical protein
MNKKKSHAWSVTNGLYLPTVRGSMPGSQEMPALDVPQSGIEWVTENRNTPQASILDNIKSFIAVCQSRNQQGYFLPILHQKAGVGDATG